jgi:pSer/pThr/pTyr-binding forkhead associated (FHA) protein
LAFDSSQPVYEGRHDDNDWKPQRDYVTPEPIYKPYQANSPQFQSPSPGASASASIYCISGELRGNTIPVTSGGITIGRDPSRCQIVLSSNDASRAHTSVVPDRTDQRAVVVTDLQSTNGTFRQTTGSSAQSFKWERIAGSAVIKQGGRFRIGKEVAEFEVR